MGRMAPMKGKMTELGVAPLIAVPSFLYIAAAIVLLSSGLRILKAFRERRLLTTGFFAIFPNPMYAAFVLLIVPGLALILDSWLLLTASAVVYALFRALVPAEDRWLRESFGVQYEEYRRRVLVKFF